MRRPLPNLPRKPILSSCHKIAQPEELDNWAVWLRTWFKKHFHCSSRREEAQKFGSFIRDQSLLTSAATILKHALRGIYSSFIRIHFVAPFFDEFRAGAKVVLLRQEFLFYQAIQFCLDLRMIRLPY